jgi:hypothetical protein
MYLLCMKLTPPVTHESEARNPKKHTVTASDPLHISADTDSALDTAACVCSLFLFSIHTSKLIVLLFTINLQTNSSNHLFTF